MVFDGNGARQAGRARYSLSGATLTLHGSGLDGLVAPVTIDPSIVVTTTADFMAGNDEALISFDTDAVSRRPPSGGQVKWGGAPAFGTARYNHTTAAWNGYVSVVGGNTGSTCLDDVQFAPINSDETIGSWTTATSFSTPRASHATAIYSGYLYVTGGTNGPPMNDVQFAPLNADGSVGTWSATNSCATGRNSHTSVAYNGHLYAIGGCDGTTYYDLLHVAALNPDGTVEAWSAGTFMTGGLYDRASVAFDDYLYVIGGRRASSNCHRSATE